MSKSRILLADDDPEHRHMLAHALAHGRDTIDVLSTGSRDALLQAAREGPVDCAVIDYAMPPFTAPSIVADLRAILPDVPIVVVSASDEQRVVIESFRTGAVIDFMPKADAMRSGALWDRVERAMAASRRAREQRASEDRRIEAMRRAAETDSLTGLYNRRYFERFASSSRITADRRRRTAGVMIDIDHFKRINDTHGHAAGDEALRRVSKILRRTKRPADVAVRWGGEEFLLLMRSVDLTDAWVWADAFRREVAAETWVFEGRRIAVRASVGVHVGATTDLERALIPEADRALYLAKDLGRNRVCTAPMVRAMDAALAAQASVAAPVVDRLDEWLSAINSTLGPVQRDHVGRHGESVERIAGRLGRQLRLDSRDLEDLRLAARLHDIGKAGVPESLLAKPARLTPDERLFVDEHAQFGADLASALGAGDRVCAIIAAHHERFDDAASSHADVQHDSQRLASVLGVADAIVSMRANRPYAGPRSVSQTLAEIRSERGRQFDPDVVDVAQFIDRAVLEAA